MKLQKAKSESPKKPKEAKPKRREKTSSRVPPVEIKSDEPHFSPSDAEPFFRANVPFGVSGARQISLSHRNSAAIDCGVDVKIPAGYKMTLELVPELRDKGLDIYKNVIIGDNRVVFCVRNLGREISVVGHRDRVVSARIEPIYPLTFKISE